MHLSLLLQMAADGMADRPAMGRRGELTSMGELAAMARRAAQVLAEAGGERVAMVDLNSDAVPVALFGAALAGKPFVPINYRLSDDQLRAIVARTAPAVVIVGEGVAQRIGDVDGIEVLDRDAFLAAARDPRSPELVDVHDEGDAVAVLLYTSGTTGDPKAAVLRHRNLASYVFATIEFASAGEDEASIVSVPPYHIAGVSSVLSATFSGRRVVRMEAFDPVEWVALVRSEGVTHAMVVPTMLARILDAVEADGDGLPSLRALSYGGGPMPRAVIERAMSVLPEVDFVNAYGLTETSSTIAVLGPEDHRTAFTSTDPAVRSRLGSVGVPLPSVEVTIRDGSGVEVGAGAHGEIWVRGDQVSGEYLGRGGIDDGWFNTRDAGYLDADGYLYVGGRLDDVIVRGGENLSPGEIEAVLLEHPSIQDAAVVGLPDEEWGERVVAAVVLVPDGQLDQEEVRRFVRGRLRSTRTPEQIVAMDELPYNETGKLLRRVLRDELHRSATTA